MILSPHGEGYCTDCQFMVGLEEDGLLEVHYRGVNRDACPGSDTRPGRRVPKESRNAAFTTKAEQRVCATCSRKVSVRRGLGPGELYLSRHTTAAYTTELCPDSFLKLNK